MLTIHFFLFDIKISVNKTSESYQDRMLVKEIKDQIIDQKSQHHLYM